MINEVSRDDIDKKIEEAERAESCGELGAALAAWKVVTQMQETEEHLLRYGRLAYNLQRWQESEEAYTRAIEIEPKSGFALQLMGSLWAARTDKDHRVSFETAKSWLLRAAALRKNTYLFTKLGAVYVELEDIESAEEAFCEALALDDTNEEAMYNLALLYETKNPEKAAQLLEQAIDKDPEYGLAHQALGRVLEQEEDYLAAEYHFRRCLEIDSNDYWSVLYLADCLAMQGEDADAEQLYRRAISLDPEVESGYTLYANFLDSNDEPERAARVRLHSISVDQ